MYKITDFTLQGAFSGSNIKLSSQFHLSLFKWSGFPLSGTCQPQRPGPLTRHLAEGQLGQENPQATWLHRLPLHGPVTEKYHLFTHRNQVEVLTEEESWSMNSQSSSFLQDRVWLLDTGAAVHWCIEPLILYQSVISFITNDGDSSLTAATIQQSIKPTTQYLIYLKLFAYYSRKLIFKTLFGFTLIHFQAAFLPSSPMWD